MIAVYYYQHGCKNYQFLIKIDGFRKKNFKSWWSCTIMPVSLHPLLYSTISRRIYDIGCIQNDTAHWALNKLFLSSNWYIPLDLKIWSSVSGVVLNASIGCVQWCTVVGIIILIQECSCACVSLIRCESSQ